MSVAGRPKQQSARHTTPGDCSCGAQCSMQKALSNAVQIAEDAPTLSYSYSYSVWHVMILVLCHDSNLSNTLGSRVCCPAVFIG